MRRPLIITTDVLQQISDDWVAELERLDADVLLVGHSHVPFIRRIGGKVIVNPGSVGQPRSGDARASYAVWDDGEFILRKAHYPVETTVARGAIVERT